MDKKLSQLDPAKNISAGDIMGIVQDLVTGRMLQVPVQALKGFILGGTSVGARIYFSPRVPDGLTGIDNDVAFDTQGKGIYLKISGKWMLQDYYGTTGGVQRIATTLSAEATSYKSTALAGSVVLDVSLDGVGLKERIVPGKLAQDEWRQDELDTSIINFGQAVSAGVFIRILYNV